MNETKKTVERRGKQRKFQVPHLRVSKESFDHVLGKLIQSPPEKREDVKPDKKKPEKLIPPQK